MTAWIYLEHGVSEPKLFLYQKFLHFLSPSKILIKNFQFQDIYLKTVVARFYSKSAKFNRNKWWNFYYELSISWDNAVWKKNFYIFFFIIITIIDATVMHATIMNATIIDTCKMLLMHAIIDASNDHWCKFNCNKSCSKQNTQLL